MEVQREISTVAAVTVRMPRHSIIDYLPRPRQWWAQEVYIFQLTLPAIHQEVTLTVAMEEILILIRLIQRILTHLKGPIQPHLLSIKYNKMVQTALQILSRRQVSSKDPHLDKLWKRTDLIAGILHYKKGLTELVLDLEEEMKGSIEEERKNNKRIPPIIKVGKQQLLREPSFPYSIQRFRHF